MRTTAFLVLALLSTSSEAESFDIRIEVEDETVVPGAPIIGKMSVSHEGEEAIAYTISYRSMRCLVLDSSGEVVQVYRHPAWQNELSGLYWVHFPPVLPGEDSSRQLVLSYWCSSQLPSGRYTLLFEIDSLGYWNGPPRTTELQAVEHSPSKRIQVPITVREPATVALHRIYANWLKRIDDYVTSAQAIDMEDIRTAIEAVLYAQHPVALESQIALLRRYWRSDVAFWEKYYVSFRSSWASIKEAYAIDIGRYFIGTKDARVAKALLQLAEDVQEDKDSFFHRNPRYLNWMIYDLHDSGGAEVVEETSSYVTKHPRLLAPQMYEFLN